jgi:hypothetical protein
MIFLWVNQLIGFFASFEGVWIVDGLALDRPLTESVLFSFPAHAVYPACRGSGGGDTGTSSFLYIKNDSIAKR